MSGYPNQPQGGWPDQPPHYSGRPDHAGGTDYPGAPDYGYQRPVRRRRRGRGWIVLLVILILLAVAFVIGDQVARSYAQNMIAAKFKSEGLSVKPSVSIKGWPFLTQVAGRDVRTIDISASNFTQDKLDIASMNATATGVHINSSFNGATIDSITGTVLITYSSAASAIGVPGLTFTDDPSAGPNTAKVSDGPISTTAHVDKAGPYKIGLQLQDLQALQGLPVQVPSSFTLNLPRFPAGIQLSGVSLTAQGLKLSIAAQNTTLSQNTAIPQS
ncbi:MAG: LmeA family phospholipid-binding protein [Trebonia sp.]